jgi:hypothetical protein
MNSQLAGLRRAALIAIACSASAAFAAEPQQLRTVTLSWAAPTENTDGSPLTDLQGYYIYVGDAPDSMIARYYTDAQYSSIDLGYWDTITRYFAVSAVTVDGVESAVTGPVSSAPR